METVRNPPLPKPSLKAFTLLELLLVLAIIGLFSGVFIASMNVMFNVKEGKSVEQVFEEAVREARLLSARDKAPVQLLFDEDIPAFRLKQGGEFFTFPLKQGEQSYSVRFLQERSRDSFILLGGQLVETEPVDRVVFFPDGSCTPFIVEFGVGREVWKVKIDPWTGVPLPAQE